VAKEILKNISENFLMEKVVCNAMVLKCNINTLGAERVFIISVARALRGVFT
jgi:hypothetical protein